MSSCGCIYVGDVDGADFGGERIQQARKRHTCGECGCHIEPKQKYEYYSGMYESEFVVAKTCLTCKSIRDVFFCAGWWYGRVLDDLIRHIDDLEGQISADCILGLTPEAREVVFDLIEEAWAEVEKG